MTSNMSESGSVELRRVLLPFANLDIRHLADQPSERIVWQVNESVITLGDIREARKVLGIDENWSSTT